MINHFRLKPKLITMCPTETITRPKMPLLSDSAPKPKFSRPLLLIIRQMLLPWSVYNIYSPIDVATGSKLLDVVRGLCLWSLLGLNPSFLEAQLDAFWSFYEFLDELWWMLFSAHVK